MDSSLRNGNLTVDELNTSPVTHHEETVEGEHEPHIHLPGPSWWPMLLSGAILLTVIGLLFIPDTPWLVVIGAPLILVGILGWALQDPMAAPKERYVVMKRAYNSPFAIGQDVVDKDGEWLGAVQARFKKYILVESGDLFVKAYYVPVSLAEPTIANDTVRLTVDEADLLRKGLDTVPGDLYDDAPEPESYQVRGVPMFARGPLSPAETGHYLYGPNSPGINTDAAGSYRREDVVPVPQHYVANRRKLYKTSHALPPRAISAD